MPSTVRRCRIPPQSRLASRLEGAYFHDSWSVVPAQPGLPALEQFLRAVRRAPWWMESLMLLRNVAGKLVGLKYLGGLRPREPGKPFSAYRPGDRVGLFTLFEISSTEVVLGDCDRHLDVMVSVLRTPAASGIPERITTSTVVYVKNLLGRAYMMPVTPVHRRIAPSLLRRMEQP